MDVFLACGNGNGRGAGSDETAALADGLHRRKELEGGVRFDDVPARTSRQRTFS